MKIELTSNFPDTAEQRKAGMAAFRAKILASYQREIKNTKNAKVAHFQQDMIDTIKAAQLKRGETA